MKSQINSLTATRAFAAIMIFIFHFGRTVFPFNMAFSIFANGNVAVGYFYVLSGFVLTISYLQKNISYVNFIKKRLTRIVPAYMLALCLSVIVYFYIYHMPYVPDLVTQIVYSFFFIQAYFRKYVLVLNTAGWSISVEMLFYLLFPVLLLLQQRKPRLFAGMAIVVFVAVQVSYHFYLKNLFIVNENFPFDSYHPIMHVNEFFVGMLGGYLFRKEIVAREKTPFAPLIIFVLMLLCVAFRPPFLFYHVGLCAPLFMFFIITTARNNPAFLNLKPLVFLGEISYGIYILQYPVYATASTLNDTYLKLSPQYFFWFALLILCIAATASYYLLEMPFRYWVNRAARKKRPAA